MRLHFTLSPNTETVPFDYQYYLTGRFHAWLGDNDVHDAMSLYSLSWLHGGVTMRNGKRIEGGLDFPQGARWFISAYDHELLHQICRNAVQDIDVCCGMEVKKIEILPPPRVSETHYFKVSSPVLARSKEIDGKVRHYTYSDNEADAVLTQTLRHKLDKAGLGQLSANTQVRFDRTYQKAHTKLVTINGIANRGSICPVIVEGSPEAVEFAWSVGIGHLTGNGFGSLI